MGLGIELNTAHENLAEKYEELLRAYNSDKILLIESDHTKFLEGVLTGIEMAIHTLDITIPGINDRK